MIPRHRPFNGTLLRDTCPECGNRLWGLTFGAVADDSDPNPVRMHVAICGRCDRPAEPGMAPRLIHPETHEPIPQPVTSIYDKDWLIFLLILAVIAGAVLMVVSGHR